MAALIYNIKAEERLVAGYICPVRTAQEGRFGPSSVSPLVGVAVQGMDRMEVCCRADETQTVLQWHELVFRQWWRWRSPRKGGRPSIRQEMRALIRLLSRENVLWSAETIQGHLVLLGFDPPCPDTIRKY